MNSRLASLVLVVSLLLSVNVLNAQGIGGSVTASVPHSVQGVPFSADVINEHRQVLSDGNRIDQETHGKMYRDSQGRIRNEMEMALPNGDKQQHISIHDPVQQVNILLDPSRKTAQVRHFPSPAPNVSRPAPFQPQEHPVMPPNIEQLGHMTIEGIDAIGMRITRTTPANTVGNAEPLVAVTETWRSPELNIVLLTKNSDPQHGENVHKLVNIQRVEPDPMVFQIPADYVVDDYPAPK